MIVYKSADTADELVQILALQHKNLNAELSEKERKYEGFVTVSHNLETLKAMNDVCPHIIAMSNQNVVGYALCMHPKFGDQIDVLKSMFGEIGTIIPKVENYMVMGQICIAKEYRKQGIFRKLYETMKYSIVPTYTCIITEVDSRNSRSLNAHSAIGFTLLKRYFSEGRQWELIILK